MTKKPKRPRDQNQLAKLIADIATGEQENEKYHTHEGKRKAGEKGAKTRNKNLTPEQRTEIAHIAAQARWKKGD